jgi:hypothetical protein
MSSSAGLVDAPSCPVAVRPTSRNTEAGAGSNPLPDAALVMAVVVLLLGLIAPRLSTVVQMALTVVFLMLANPAYLPAIMVLQFTATDFRGGIGASMEGQYERFDALVIYIAGFPFTPNHFLLIGLTLRVLYDVLTRPSVFRSRASLWLLVPWAVALGFAIESSFMGLADRNPAWTMPTRMTMTFLGLWYGVAISRDQKSLAWAVRDRLPWIMVAAFVLAFFGLFANRLTWMLMSMAVLLGFVFVWPGEGERRRPTMGWTLLALSGLLAFGFTANPEVAERVTRQLGGVSSTLSTILIWMGSLGLAYVGLRARRSNEKRGLWYVPLAATVAYVAFLVFPFIVAAATEGVDVEVKSNAAAASYWDRIMLKLFHERASLWRGAISQIKEPPHVFVPAGRPGVIITNAGRSIKWKFGAHNIVLFALESEGLVLGSLSLLFYYLALLAAARGMAFGTPFVARVTAPCVIALIFGAGVGGMAIAEPATGVFLFVLAGASIPQPRATPYRNQLQRAADAPVGLAVSA